ncbi:MAG: exonuclease domain-containing protein, partial [Candidatus Poribacteria bacterium]|nr:exonuclease domain-containing protein [Candidatus Poribacteria bacterium]
EVNAAMTVHGGDSENEVDGGVSILIGDAPEPPETSRVVWLNAPESARGNAICPRPPENAPRVASWVAHLLCQRMLASAEEPQGADVVVYDLETTGNNPRLSEIIEFAGQKLGATEQHEHLYVKPKRAIPEFLTRIHGVTNDFVRDKPPIEEQIVRIRAFLADAILVGHNIVEFDNRVIGREMEAHLRENLPNPSYDTLTVARRLFPHENHKLDALAERFGIPYPTQHRADHDAEVSKALFHRLRGEESTRRAQVSLPEFLPFVAIGILSREAWEDDRFTPYRHATARWLESHDVRRNVLDTLPVTHRAEGRQSLDAVRRVVLPETEDGRRWDQLKARFLRRAVRYAEISGDATLRDFLNSQALVDGVDEHDAEKDAVTLMTLHSAKGTEFRAVIMYAMEDGILPSFRADKSPEMMAEERRLCYVGMTRAKERLYFVVGDRRQGRERSRSRFMREIPSNLVKEWRPKSGSQRESR